MCTWWSEITIGNQEKNILGYMNKKEYILDNTLKSTRNKSKQT